MNLKNCPKEIAYVKLILPLSLLPYKSATGNNRPAVTGSEVDRTTCFKFLKGIQCHFVDIIFRSSVARFARSFRKLEQYLSQILLVVH